jgi:1-acyl-sn-glycerol-3-phosphate acyltransferase
MSRTDINKETYEKHASRFRKYINNRFEKIDINGIDSLSSLEEDALIIYVANHKSHADWASVGLTLYEYGLNVPRFIATNRLRKIPFIGSYFESLGAFFIDTDKQGLEYLNPLRREIAQEMVQKGEDLLFFPEGGRSYKGHLREMHTYFFSLPLEILKNTKDRPVYVVPLAISYDLVMEDRLLIKLNKEERKEDVSDFFWTMFTSRFFNSNQGKNIYIDFGEPVNVREFLERKNNIGELADYTFDQIGSLYRVNPTSLVARCINMHFAAPFLEIERKVYPQIEIIAARNGNLKTIDNFYYREKGTNETRLDLDRIVKEGVKLLKRRGAIYTYEEYDDKEKEMITQVKVKNQALLDYYASMLQHFFGEKKRTTRVISQ